MQNEERINVLETQVRTLKRIVYGFGCLLVAGIVVSFVMYTGSGYSDSQFAAVDHDHSSIHVEHHEHDDYAEEHHSHPDVAAQHHTHATE